MMPFILLSAWYLNKESEMYQMTGLSEFIILNECKSICKIIYK